MTRLDYFESPTIPNIENSGRARVLRSTSRLLHFQAQFANRMLIQDYLPIFCTAGHFCVRGGGLDKLQ